MKEIIKAIAEWILSHKRCEHDWENIGSNPLRNSKDEITGHIWTFHCTECTKSKKIKSKG